VTLWFATGNVHKRTELAGILTGHDIRIPSDAGIAAFDPEETGNSFLENSLLKARALYRLLARQTTIKGPVIADDSGLCVDALGGRPGIHSARYAGPGSGPGPGVQRPGGRLGGKRLCDSERNALLLAELGGKQDRRARFVCAMILLWDENRFYGVQETLEGVIIPDQEGRGEGGFGYDPILYIPELGRTVAELSAEEKNRVSHRGKAARAIAKLLAGD
jgi:XTP/dITP diphosphohydrolase